jgi:hypothetical protein
LIRLEQNSDGYAKLLKPLCGVQSELHPSNSCKRVADICYESDWAGSGAIEVNGPYNPTGQQHKGQQQQPMVPSLRIKA